jgi:PAS domain S-box-containing protein
MGLGTYVLYLNKKTKLNQVFFLVVLTGFIYSFTTVMMWSSTTPETAFIWHKLGTMWPLFIVAVLHFALEFTENKWIKFKIHYLALYIPAIVVWLVDLTTDLINTPPILKYWGYNDLASGTLFYDISTLWSAFIPLFAFGLCLHYYLKVKEPTQRQRAKYVTIGFFIPIICFVATNMVSRSIGIDVPNLGPFSTFFFVLFVGYAITKYDLFTIDAVLAAENLAATIPGSVLLSDMQGNILKVNNNFITNSGYTKEEIIGQRIAKFCSEAIQERIITELSNVKEIHNREVILQIRDGTSRNYLFSGSVIYNRSNRSIGLTFILNDITQRKLAEQELANTKNYLETLLNSMLTGVLVINATTHRVVDANSAALSMIGLRREEVVGRICHKFVCPADCGRCPITDLGLDVHNDEKILLTSTGEEKQILKSVIKLQLKDQLLLIENFIDISQRKAMETQLIKAQKLASIGELAGQLGHDLRNPLAGIRNGIYLIKKKGNRVTETEREEIIRIIEVAITDSNRIVSSLIDYSSELQIMPALHTPKALVASVLSKIEFPPRITVQTEVLDETSIMLDTEHLERVFTAILQNSIQAIPEAGTVKIQAVLCNSTVVFSFSDTGIGIPENVLPNIFNPLVTTKAKGMGMGLAISKRVIEAHGGEIALESQAGVGTTVKIILPITGPAQNSLSC